MDPQQISSAATRSCRSQRRSVSLVTKLDIIKRTEKGEKQAHIARHYGVNRSSIATIIKDKERIMDAIKQTTPILMSRIVTNRNYLLHEMEKLLFIWIEKQKRDHMTLSKLTIQKKAKNIFEDVRKKAGPKYVNEHFSASSAWLSRFKGRAKLYNLRLKGELEDTDTQDLYEFPEPLIEIKVEDGYDEVYNTEELTTDEIIKTQVEIKSKPPEKPDIPTLPKTFTKQKMAAAFKSISEGLTIFEEEDANTNRFQKVKKGVYDSLACYSEIFEEKEKPIVPSSIGKDFKTTENITISSLSEALPSTSSKSNVTYVDIKSKISS